MSERPRRLPVALTIAGSDSGAGAGLQADLKTFASLDVHGTSVVTCVTAQNPKRVLTVEACGPEIIEQQLEAVFEELPPNAVKTGMLYSSPIIRTVADFLKAHRRAIVVDPVMVSTSGAELLERTACRALTENLLGMAALVTPNVPEAEALTGKRIASLEDLREAARGLHARFGCAALVKGGHLRGLREAADIFYDGQQELLLSAPFVRGIHTHGTGCTYAAAITAWLARGVPLTQAVIRAKNYITQAIARSLSVGRHSVLFWG